MSFQNDENLQEFTIEANELLDSAETELLNAEKGKSNTFYDSVFRAFHSIKGGAGMLGLEVLQSHMHKVENQWLLLKGKAQPSKQESEYFLAAIDAGRKILNGDKIDFDYSGPRNVENTAASQKTTAVAEASAKAEKTSKKSLANKAKPIIYVVDDESNILTFVKEVLEDESFEVSCFLTADELLATIKKKSPDVVITDYKMPEKSGLEVLREVKQLQPDIPVIMLTGYITKDILIESLRDGAFYRAIEKPFKEVNLIQDCWSAYRYHEIKKMMRKSIHLLVYQFSDLEKFLISKGQEDVAKTIGNELKELLEKQRALNQAT